MSTLSMFHPRPDGRPPTVASPLATLPPSPASSAALDVEQAAAPNPFVEVAARLLSETAQDLRSPLTCVRKLIRLVFEGDLGDTTAAQREMLADAIGQCDVIDSLVANMLQLDRLRSGLPRTRRDWIAPAEIAESVSASIEGVAVRRQAQIHWRGFDGRSGLVFGDRDLLCRLLTNLLSSAIAASEEGGGALVRLEPPQPDGFSRLSVSDHGPGMSLDQIERIQQRGVSGTGGSGLGLAICRALAALHFSHLSIDSPMGNGTRISFELPAAGPASVAAAFVRWREAYLPSFGRRPKTARPQTARANAGGRTATPSEAARQGSARQESDHWTRNDAAHLQAPSETFARLPLPFDGPSPRFARTATIVAVRIAGKASDALSTAIDCTLHSDQRLHELVYRTDARRWVLIWDASLEETQRRIDSLDRQIRSNVDSADLVWSEPAEQPLGGRANRARICEQFIRDMLRSSGRRIVGHDRSGRTLDPADETVETALRRLEEELQRLTNPLARQSHQLQSQAARITRAAI